MRDTVQFSITGEQTIHCASCEARIERALRRVAGVQDVRANADTQLCEPGTPERPRRSR